jgi:hypothetical protein
LPRNAPVTAYLQRDQSLAAWYLSVGATGPASEALERVKANQEIAQKNAASANALQLALYREASENYRADKTIAAGAAKTNADNLTRAAVSEASNATRAAVSEASNATRVQTSQANRADRDMNEALNRLARRDIRDANSADADRRLVTGIALKHAFDVRNNPAAQRRAADNAAKLRAEYQEAYAKATHGGTVVNQVSGRSQQVPPTISGPAKVRLDAALAKVNSETQDPVGVAMRLADGQPAEVVQILMDAGKARQALLESQGQPVWNRPAGATPAPAPAAAPSAPAPAPSAEPTASGTDPQTYENFGAAPLLGGLRAGESLGRNLLHGGGPQFPNPPGLPPGAKYIGRGPTGGDEYAFPNGTHKEYKP